MYFAEVQYLVRHTLDLLFCISRPEDETVSNIPGASSTIS